MTSREFARNQNLLDFVGAVVNLKDTGVAIVFFNRIVVDESISAVDLDRGRADALRHLRSEQLRYRSFLAAPPLGLFQVRRGMAHRARNLELGCHFRELEPDALVIE